MWLSLNAQLTQGKHLIHLKPTCQLNISKTPQIKEYGNTIKNMIDVNQGHYVLLLEVNSEIGFRDKLKSTTDLQDYSWAVALVFHFSNNSTFLYTSLRMH